MNKIKIRLLLLAIIASSTLIGCGKSSPMKIWNPLRSWHSNVGWKAEDYFTDPKVIELCCAIENKDVEEMDKLIKDGANVNAKGPGNMTPLLWSFSAGEECFKKLLENGADPNVIVTSYFGVPQVIQPGRSVTQMAAGTDFPNYFKLVMENGGDPNLKNPEVYNHTPIFFATNFGKIDNVKLLIEKGADIDFQDNAKYTPLINSVQGNQFEITLLLLEAGADYTMENCYYETVAHHLAQKETMIPMLIPSRQEAYHKTIEWLKQKDVLIETKDEQRQRDRAMREEFIAKELSGKKEKRNKDQSE